MLGRRGHPVALLRVDERRPQARDRPRLPGVGALELVDEVPGLAIDIKHRSEVDVDPDRVEVRAGAGARRPRQGGGVPALADLLLR